MISGAPFRSLRSTHVRGFFIPIDLQYASPVSRQDTQKISPNVRPSRYSEVLKGFTKVTAKIHKKDRAG